MKIWKLLLLLYLFSVLLSIVLSFVFILFTVKGQWDNHLVPSTLVGALVLNIPITLIEIPGLFMSINFKNAKSRAFISCLLTPVAILLYVLLGTKLQNDDKQFYALHFVAQIIVLCFMFFRKLTPDNIVEED
ncbi:hypothetical protein [Mucilaginibacter sp. OK283]|jgi:hypothetical protein|uniref:hypothetical protein n=1 Tax=Mucilaginibacter sp. OK283 TaxID=1881049 RepID=UPI0008B30AC9|nr:hypothetical protein [Mucilaginibacter sp. OK283]SEP43775.1 hypothetical protein SAMN05428947_1196 [Mucilaginibacter sp. OK283]